MPTTYYRSNRKSKKSSRARPALLVVGTLVAVFVLIQFIPYGHAHANPPVTAPFKWTSPQAKTIAERACYSCHSNQTTYWWGVDIAPFSWLAQHDIDAGRSRLNFSEWNGGLSAQELRRVLDGGMPPLQYTLVHPDAKLSAADKQTLIAGFEESLAAENGGGAAAGAAADPSSAPSAGASPSPAAAAADATAIISARCSTCHSSSPALQYHASSAAEAQGLIDSMIQQGAAVSQAEEQALIEYYTR
jgi:uncharacterized membrane protein